MSIEEDFWEDHNEVCQLAAQALYEMAGTVHGKYFAQDMRACLNNSNRKDAYDMAYALLHEKIADVLNEAIDELNAKENQKSEDEKLHDYMEANGYDRS